MALPKSSSRTRKVSNTLWKYIKDVVAKNDRNNIRIAGATNEVATLKEVVSEVERNAATECTEREKQEARVAEVRQELQALVEKHESWSVTQILESPSWPRLLGAPKPLRPKPKKPSRKLRQ